MFGKGQGQTAAAGSTALQAGRDVNVAVQGMSYSDVRDIALDVFRSNLQEFKGIAAVSARERGEKITDKFLDKLQREHAAGLQQAQTPDFQDALFTVQKEYAKAGDDELGDLLVDLLVDRTKEPQRNILQIVLNESLHTAPKLTNAQVSTLSAIFLLRYVQFTGAVSPQTLAQQIRRHLEPAVAGGIATSQASFGHLSFTGCGTVQMGSLPLEDIWAQEYAGLFRKGFDQGRPKELGIREESVEKLLIPCLHDSSKQQLSAARSTVLDTQIERLGIDGQQAQLIRNLYSENAMGSGEIRPLMLGLMPTLKPVIDAWPETPMQSFDLSSVGMAIAHANIKRFVGEFAPLKIWIN